MLVRFLVGNYKSFDEIQEFSMIAGKTRSKTDHYLNQDKYVKLLRLGAVFGANASGKSNLVSAMHFAQSVIFNNMDDVSNDVYYKLNEDNREKPSYFEFEIQLQDRYYAYGFEMNIYHREIVAEWLYERTPYKDKLLFERDLIEGTFLCGFKNIASEIKQKLDVYIDDNKNNTQILFLNEMNRNKDSLYQASSEIRIISEVYHWFRRTLEVNDPEEPVTDYSYFKTDNKKEVLDIIKSFGTGISDFKIIDSSLDDIVEDLPSKLITRIKKDINSLILYKQDPNRSQIVTNAITIRGKDSIYIIFIDQNNDISVNTIVFEHGDNEMYFKLSEESDGTKRLLDLIEILIPNQDEKVFVIDEFDRSLHPQLTYKFVELFLSGNSNHNKQFIITTHESRLLDFELLRRDEIWFVEKKNGTSDLYSLEAFNERFDKKIDKAYLDGRYGGVPIFTTLYPVKETS